MTRRREKIPDPPYRVTTEHPAALVFAHIEAAIRRLEYARDLLIESRSWREKPPPLEMRIEMVTLHQKIRDLEQEIS